MTEPVTELEDDALHSEDHDVDPQQAPFYAMAAKLMERKVKWYALVEEGKKTNKALLHFDLEIEFDLRLKLDDRDDSTFDLCVRFAGYSCSFRWSIISVMQARDCRHLMQAACCGVDAWLDAASRGGPFNQDLQVPG